MSASGATSLPKFGLRDFKFQSLSKFNEFIQVFTLRFIVITSQYYCSGTVDSDEYHTHVQDWLLCHTSVAMDMNDASALWSVTHFETSSSLNFVLKILVCQQLPRNPPPFPVDTIPREAYNRCLDFESQAPDSESLSRLSPLVCARILGLVMCRAWLNLNARAWAWLWRARTCINWRPGPQIGPE